MRLQKCIGPIEDGDKLMQKWTCKKNPDLEKTVEVEWFYTMLSQIYEKKGFSSSILLTIIYNIIVTAK